VSVLLQGLALEIAGKAQGDLVFGDGRTHLDRPHARNGWFLRAVGEAQSINPTFPRVTIHDLRHTAASLAVSAGGDVKAVQRMLGQASAPMTLDTSAGLFDDDLDAVSDRLNEVRTPLMSESPTEVWGPRGGRGTTKAPDPRRYADRGPRRWRRMGDSNPRGCYTNTLSKRAP
jgi:hypothetical protein